MLAQSTMSHLMNLGILLSGTWHLHGHSASAHAKERANQKESTNLSTS